jgi:sortase A
MDSGQSPENRQRQTAAELARERVLKAYQKTAKREQKSADDAAKRLNDNDPNNDTKISTAEWQKYHSAWQNYYQKYYSNYYSEAARNYVAKEKFKVERKAAEEREALEEAGLNQKSDDIIISQDNSAFQSSFEARFRARMQDVAKKSAKNKKRHKKLVPILAGLAVVLTFLFLQYNRLIFAPIVAYVSPGNADTEITPVDSSVQTAVSAENKLIIPKINVDVPVHFGISNDTKTVMSAMNNGVAQFAIPGASAMPGEIGNLVITGHSAGDIYSSNQYKFIFSGLERLVPGDSIYLDYNQTRYTYKVTELKTVEPSDVAALQIQTDKPMLTLITCTPLGTSRYRLLVFSEQISPSPSGETQAESTTEVTETTMPSNEKTFFENIWSFLTGGE